MKRITLALAGGCLVLSACGGNDNGAPSDAFIGFVQQQVAATPDNTEPQDVEQLVQTSPEDSQPIEV